MDRIIAEISKLRDGMNMDTGEGDENGVPDSEGFSLTPENIDAINESIDNVVKGLGCGF